MGCATRSIRAASSEASVAETLLDIRGLKTWFKTDDGMVRAVDGVDLRIDQGETVGVVGESGCGKTVTARSVLKLIDMPPGRFEAGQILWRGRDLVPAEESEMNKIRSREIAIIFQEPMTSLNPVYTVGDQIAEVIAQHQKLNKKQAMAGAAEMLRLVNIPNPQRRVRDYPHQFSGGMRQRVMIAMALSCQPRLLIADEPTTALDVTIQAQILELMQEMKDRFGMSIMLITHAMGVVAETCQRVTVMYAGKVVEEAPVKALFGDPRHPYTQGLIRSIPRVDRAARHKEWLEAIPGTVPSLLEPPPGCRFAARCKYVTDICVGAMPPLKEVAPGHFVRCVL
jgi:peptide/nickel transport system ATP-binding protein